MHVIASMLIAQLIFTLESKAISLNISVLNSSSSRLKDPEYVYRSYQTSVYCSASSEILFPKDISEVQEIIRRARQLNQTVKAVGSRHSLTDIICTDGIPISMQHFTHKSISEYEENGTTITTATFGSGLEVQSALEFLEWMDLTLIQIPAYSGITIGGAIGTGAHASSLKHPNTLSEQILSLKIVDGLGTIQNITDPIDLNAFRVHLGLLGIIIDVTLKTVPLFKMTVHNEPFPDTILLDGTAVKWAQEHDWFQLWWFPTYHEVVVSRGTYIGANAVGNASTNLIPDIDPILLTSSAVMFETLQMARNKPGLYVMEAYTKLSLYTTTLGKPPIFSEGGRNNVLDLRNPATGYAWRLQANKCSNKCAWDHNGGQGSMLPEESSMGFEFSEERFRAVIEMIREVLKQEPVSFYMIGLFIRFSRKSNSLMGISAGRNTFTVEWTAAMRNDRYNDPKDGLGAMQAMLQEMVENHGGRPHWGKNGLYFHSSENMRKSRPGVPQFVNAMKKFDADGTFLNKFGLRILQQSEDMDVDPSVTRCALQDYCVCESAKDCGNFQDCVRLNGFPICKDRPYFSINPSKVKFNQLGNWNLISILSHARSE